MKRLFSDSSYIHWYFRHSTTNSLESTIPVNSTIRFGISKRKVFFVSQFPKNSEASCDTVCSWIEITNMYSWGIDLLLHASHDKYNKLKTSQHSYFFFKSIYPNSWFFSIGFPVKSSRKNSVKYFNITKSWEFVETMLSTQHIVIKINITII